MDAIELKACGSSVASSAVSGSQVIQRIIEEIRGEANACESDDNGDAHCRNREVWNQWEQWDRWEQGEEWQEVVR